jgi:parvulin-like peptidyl-prolyl isomerase
MSEILQVKNQQIPTGSIVTLLANYQMFSQFLQEVITDQAIESFACTQEEQTAAVLSFYEKWQLTSDTARQEWLQLYEMTQAQLEILATRDLRIEKFKQATWGHRLSSHFLDRKASLDRVIYSIIRTKNSEQASEIYFRLQAREQSFYDLAHEFSREPEVQYGSVIGPIELGKIPTKLAQQLYGGHAGQLLFPFSLGEWIVIVQLEEILPVSLDEDMRQRLLDELFAVWLQEELAKLSNSNLIELH